MGFTDLTHKFFANYFEIFPTCITPMTSFRLINNIWPEFPKLFATHPITILNFTHLDETLFHLCKDYKRSRNKTDQPFSLFSNDAHS